jgi:hypothetical protein
MFSPRQQRDDDEGEGHQHGKSDAVLADGQDLAVRRVARFELAVFAVEHWFGPSEQYDQCAHLPVLADL